MGRKQFNFWFWLATKLPRGLVYCCFIHIMAYSTTEKYGNTEVPALTGMDAIERYSKDFNL